MQRPSADRLRKSVQRCYSTPAAVEVAPERDYELMPGIHVALKDERRHFTRKQAACAGLREVLMLTQKARDGVRQA